MQVWPAIDLRGGKCVRLRQGDYSQETIYGEDPATMARQWVERGARQLHLVDLDGARDGMAGNRLAVEAIRKAVSIPLQLGGGIRSEADINQLISIGIERLVIGTLALKEPKWFREMCHKFPQHLVLGLDARNGKVATEGWLEESTISAIELARTFEADPIAAIVYTDIARDGMLAGPNFSGLAEMQQAVSLPVIASGGVTTLSDVTQLVRYGLSGCIIGRALYEHRLTLEEALAAADSPQPQASRTG